MNKKSIIGFILYYGLALLIILIIDVYAPYVDNITTYRTVGLGLPPGS